jgi:parvulin-like peptidyl-prolyl isomerase
MAKTHHRRRHRRANRTRRGGVKSNPVSPRAASAPAAPAASAPVVFPSAPLAPAAPRVATHADLADIFKKVDQIRASHVSSASKPKKTISKKEAAKKRLSGILSGKVKHSDKSAFKGSVISDSQAARVRGY